MLLGHLSHYPLARGVPVSDFNNMPGLLRKNDGEITGLMNEMLQNANEDPFEEGKEGRA